MSNPIAARPNAKKFTVPKNWGKIAEQEQFDINEINQTLQNTYDKLEAQPKKAVYLEPNSETDFFKTAEDGQLKRYGASISINGVRYLIQAGKQVNIPAQVYELLMESKTAAENLKYEQREAAKTGVCLGRL